MSLKAAPQRPLLHRSVNPILVAPDVAALIDFLGYAFGAEIIKRLALPGGRLLHAEVLIGDTMVMAMAPKEGTPGMPCALSMYLDDVDQAYARALERGAQSLQEPTDQFYGHRTARVQDPAGNQWAIHTVLEDVGAVELQRRMTEMARRN